MCLYRASFWQGVACRAPVGDLFTAFFFFCSWNGSADTRPTAAHCSRGGCLWGGDGMESNRANKQVVLSQNRRYGTKLIVGWIQSEPKNSGADRPRSRGGSIPALHGSPAARGAVDLSRYRIFAPSMPACRGDYTGDPHPPGASTARPQPAARRRSRNWGSGGVGGGGSDKVRGRDRGLQFPIVP